MQSIAQNDTTFSTVLQLPAELRQVDQWVGWRYEKRNGKETKLPVNARSGRLAKADDPETWASFDAALAAYHAGKHGLAGVGFVFAAGDPYYGVDLDDCRDPETGTLHPDAERIVRELASYAEVSPSETGVKIIARGAKPGTLCRTKKTEWGGEIEVYDQRRFFTLTGWRLADAPDGVNEAQDALDHIYGCYFAGSTDNGDAHTSDARNGSHLPAYLKTDAAPLGVEDKGESQPTFGFTGGDDALIETMLNASNGDKVRALWNGDATAHGSASEADLALCSSIAFYTGPDRARIDLVFRRSGLMREKWNERADYRDATISKALNRDAFYESSSGTTSHGESQTRNDGHYARTDTGNAERFADQHAGKVRHCWATGRWLVWSKTHWAEDATGAVYRLATKTARGIYQEAARCTDDELRGKLAKWATASESRQRIEAMLHLARSQEGIAVNIEDLDSDPWLFNCISGTLDLKAGKLKPHDPLDLITKCAPVEYDPVTTPERWLTFLLEIFAGDEELIGFMKRMLGMSISGDVSEQLLFIMYGVGANGKSVMLDTVAHVMGDYFGLAAPDLLASSKHEGHPTSLADLQGRRLVVGSETEEEAPLKLQRVKQLTGDATVKARRMREDFYTFKRTHKLAIVTNNKPRVTEDTEAVWRRLRLIPFDTVISEDQRDLKLLDKLKGEAPAILAWLAAGCVEWQRQGLGEPEAVRLATAAYREQSDPVADFVHESCEVDPDGWISNQKMREAYEAYCNANGEKKLNEKRFGEAMKRHGVEQTKTRQGRVWHGLTFKVHAEV